MQSFPTKPSPPVSIKCRCTGPTRKGPPGSGRHGQRKAIFFSFIQFLISFESDQAHQNPENPSNMGVRVPSKRFQKQTPIECCVRPPMPQVMKVCFILVLGHRCETCTPVFYRGEKLKITHVLFAPLPRHSLEKMMQKKTCAPPFYRGCLDGGTCTPRIYNYKMGGHGCRPEFTGGYYICQIQQRLKQLPQTLHKLFHSLLSETSHR